MHLTNYAINKKSRKYKNGGVEGMTGHKRRLAAVWKVIDKLGGNSNSLKKKLYSIVIKTLVAVQPIMQEHCTNVFVNTTCF